MMKKPVTVTIDDSLDKKIRTFQANLIKKTNQNWSYSKVLNLILLEGIKPFFKTQQR